jgi:hypothetical protein
MASTSDIPLADFSRRHGDQYLPDQAQQTQSAISRESIPIDTGDAEDAWQTEQQLPSDVGEREQINLPKADGGKEAWLFLCGCFTIEALVWGRSDCLFLRESSIEGNFHKGSFFSKTAFHVLSLSTFSYSRLETRRL